MRRWTWSISCLSFLLPLSLFAAGDEAAGPAPVFAFLINPDVVYLLILLAIFGLAFELMNPGMILPGIIGIFSLLLVLYAFQLMPLNYVGLALLLIGIAFMIVEAYVGSFGIIGIGGIITFIIGSILLFDTHNPHYHITWQLILGMSLISFIFFFMIISLVIQSHKRKIVTGKEALIGKKADVISVMNQQIIVRLLGEIWEARSEQPVNQGDIVTVIGVKGLQLIVKPSTPSRKEINL